MLGTKQISINTHAEDNPHCQSPKRLVFIGGVEFYTSFWAPPSDAPTDSDGNVVAETQEQINRRLGFPSYHVDSAIYVRDHYSLRGYSFAARDSGHFKQDTSSFRQRTVSQTVPIMGYVDLNDRLVIDLHVAPSTWRRDNGGFFVSCRVRVHIKTMQLELLQA